jgi:hypothetical protein
MPALQTSPLPVPAKAPITATGIQGFLLWFQREQPALYAQIAPKLPALVPKAFSNYNSKFGRLAAIYRGSPYSQRGGSFQGFADYYSSYFSLQPVDPAPVSVDLTSEINATPIDVGSVNDTLGPIAPANIDTGSSSGSSGPVFSSPVAGAANSGSGSTVTGSVIGSVIGAAAAVAMTQQQAQLQQQAVATNLARAQAGLPPLNTSLNALGVPTVSTSGTIDSGTMILLALAAGAAILLTSSKS